MRARNICICLLFLAIWGSSAYAQNQIIARDTLGLQDLQNICTGVLGIHLCTVVEPIGDPQAQVYLVAPGVISDVNQLLQFLLGFLLPNGGAAELDQLLNLKGFTSSTSWTAPLTLYDVTPVNYYGTTVWHGYVSQPAVGIIRVA